MSYTIENEFLTASFKSFGAENCSLVSKSTQIEYLWQADPAIWPRHAPNLFPIVGRLKNLKYTFEGKEYTLPQHGFARDSEFEVEKQTKDSIVFLLKDNENTRKSYPFAFEFRISYTLDKNTLVTTYGVKNTGNSTLYFSVGAHPAFQLPLDGNGSFADYFIAFEKPETVGKYPISSDGLIMENAVPFLKNENILALRKELFLEDALVFKDLKSTSMTIKGKKTPHSISMEYKGFPFFGIWTKPGFDAFLCLEPWCGIADGVQASGELTEKEGINALPSNQLWEQSFSIIVE